MRTTIAMGAYMLAVAACAPNYVYQPAANATATIKGRVAADYKIPPASPQGEVRLASFGMSKISPSGNASEKAVHVRMIVANNSAQPWMLDASQQLMALPNGQQLSPSYVTTLEGDVGLPSVTVPAGGKRVVDLLYALPPGMQSAAQVPEFDVVWRVQTPEQVVSERTPFDRIRVEPEQYVAYDPYWDYWYGGWGGPLWYDPYFGFRRDIVIVGPHRGFAHGRFAHGYGGGAFRGGGGGYRGGGAFRGGGGGGFHGGGGYGGGGHR